ncbi:MAG: thiamine pyrophosphate-binding protein [Haloferacaceae archaeon]
MSRSATGSDYLLSALAAEGVSTLFGLVGEGNSHLVDRTNDVDVTYRYARHEQVAVMMADGYARTTGGVGVCTLTHGPGLTNGVTGLAAADRDNVPVVLVVGDTARAGAETSLQYLDHLDVTDSVSVYGTRAETPETLPEKLRSAFAAARLRSGPAVLEVPSDVQEAPAPETAYEPRSPTPGRVYPDPDRVDAAADALAASDRPVILAGGGAAAADAGPALATLAERLGAPVATTFYGRGVLPESHPLVSGIAGTFMTPATADLVPDADALLAVGAQLSGKTTRYGDLFADATVVQVDVDREAIGRHRDVDVGVVGDARATVDALADAVPSSPDRAAAVRERVRSATDPADLEFESAPDRVDPRALTAELSTSLPPETLVTVDSGNNTGFPAVFHRVEDGGRMLVNGNFGSMGYALPAALGAKVAAPDRPVVCYTGDGGFLQVIQDVETAVRYGLGVVFVVYNDESYGIIRHRQHLDFDRETASSYESPDFATVARGLGADAVTVRGLDDLEAVESHVAEGRNTPLVVDARTIPEVTRPGFPPY